MLGGSWRPFQALWIPVNSPEKIHVSFYILEVWSRMSPGQEYSAPPAPRSLNRVAFLLGELKYPGCKAVAGPSNRSVLSVPAALGREMQSTKKSGLPSSSRECKRTESSHVRVCKYHQERYIGGPQDGGTHRWPLAILCYYIQLGAGPPS